LLLHNAHNRQAIEAMATLGMMYPARGGLVWDQIRGCYLKSGGPKPPRGSITYWLNI